MRILLSIALLLLFSATTTLAQTDKEQQQQAYRKKALQEILKEKIRQPIAGTPFEDLAKTTAGQDQKITNVTSSSTQEAEVSLAYHPLDSNKVVLSFMNQTTAGLTFPIYYSSNGGQSWTKSTFDAASITNADYPGTALAGGGDPVFAWDKNGRVYFSWIYLMTKPTYDTAYFVLSWAYSDNNGQTWSVQPGTQHKIGEGVLNIMTSSVLNIGDGICDRQWMAVDNTGGPNQGTLYCSFMRFAPSTIGSGDGQYIKVKDASSNTFGPLRAAYIGTSQFGNVEVAPNGSLHLTYGEIAQQQIQHVSSSNKGLTFSTPHIVGTGQNLFGSDNQILVHERENGVPNLAVDGAGYLHAVWTSLDYAGNTFDAFYARSTNGGLTWSTQMPISSKLSARKGFMPTVAAFGNKVSITTAGIDANDSSTYYELHSNDNGATWGSPVQLSSAQSKYNNYSSQAFFGDYNRSQRTECITYSAWTDGRNGAGPKIYFSRTNSCALGVKEVSTVNGAVQLTALYPNPAAQQVNLRLQATQSGTVDASLTDLQGRVLMTRKITYAKGQQSIAWPLQNIAAGQYLLQLQGKEGTQIVRPLAVK